MRYVAVTCLCACLALACAPRGQQVPRPAFAAQPTTMPGAVAPSADAASAESAVMATINGQPIYMRELYAPLVEADGLRVAEMLIADAVVAQEAARRGLSVNQEDLAAENDRLLVNIFPGDVEADQRERLLEQLLRNRGLTSSLWEGVLRRRAMLRKLVLPEVKLTDEMVRAEYDRQYGEKVEVSHIQLATLREAEKVIQRLEAGQDFAELARKLSTNAQTASEGGKISPPFAQGDPAVPQALREAAFALKVGQISGVVQVGNSFHVLKLLQRIPAAKDDFDKLKDQLRQSLQERMVEQSALQLLSTLRAKADVQYVNPTLREAAKQATRP